MKSDFLIALTQLAAERHLPREQVVQAIEAALASAFKKDSLNVGQNISVKLNPSSGEPISVWALKTVVEEVEDSQRELTLSDARELKADAEVGEEVPTEALPLQFSRIAAQTAKQVVLQRLREVERELVFQEFIDRTDDVISGVVDQIEPGRVVIIELGRAQAVLLPEEQVPTERYRKGQRLKVYVMEVRRSAKGPEILVSRSHKNLLKRLFEIEVPEVFNGIVEIKAISREGGARSKVAVTSRQDGIDPVGSCIGMRGNRIQSIVNELQGEKIDVVRWDKDPKVFLANALSPSEVVHVEIDEAEGTALVVVPERQLSLAIGKEGQNARLAAKLTNCRLDIKSMAEWETFRAERQAAEEESRRTAVAVAEPEDETELAEAVAQVETAEPVAAELEAPVADEPEVVTAEAVIEIEAPVVQEVAPPPKEVAEVAAAEALADGLSAEELALLALEEEDELELDDEEEEEEEETEEIGAEVWTLPAVAAGAGQIRFAEDIMGDFRGGGRGRRGRGGQAGAKGKKGARGKKARTQVEEA